MQVFTLRDIVHFCEKFTGHVCGFLINRFHLTFAEILSCDDNIIAVQVIRYCEMPVRAVIVWCRDALFKQIFSKPALFFNNVFGDILLILKTYNNRRTIFKIHFYNKPDFL